MRLPDYHTHTALCGHATGRPQEYAEAAKTLGLTAIGMADHLPLLPDADPELTMSTADLPDYVAEVQALKSDYPGYVLLGIEADYRPHTVSEVGDLLRAYPFEYVIGSVHFLEDWAFDDPRFVSEYSDKDIDEVWVQYLELVGDAAESDLFTIMGHLDLVKKFGYRPTRTLDKELDRLVTRLARSGVIVEINTAGLHKPIAEAYPEPDILLRLRKADVPITFGSDAHRPEHVGRDFQYATQLAKEAGYTHFAGLKMQAEGKRAQTLMHTFADL